jgi:hypothetical protein
VKQGAELIYLTGEPIANATLQAGFKILTIDCSALNIMSVILVSI